MDILIADQESSLRELAAELRRIEQLLPALGEAYTLRTQLEGRARQLRTLWLLQETTARPLARDGIVTEPAPQDDRILPGH